jgi:hypothetical protein
LFEPVSQKICPALYQYVMNYVNFYPMSKVPILAKVILKYHHKSIENSTYSEIWDREFVNLPDQKIYIKIKQSEFPQVQDDFI